MFQIPYKTILSSFNLSNESINHFVIFTYCLYFSSLFSFFSLSFLFFFLCYVIFAHDVLVGIFAMPMVFSPNFCLSHPFEFST